jgi:hypothetical protein
VHALGGSKNLDAAVISPSRFSLPLGVFIGLPRFSQIYDCCVRLTTARWP